MARNFHSSRLSDGLCCCGSGDYDRKKKSSSRLSGGLCCNGSGNYDRKKNLSGRLSVFGSGDYDRKKKVPVVIKFVLVKLELKLIQIG